MRSLDEEIARHLREASAAGELQQAPSYGKPLAADVGWERGEESVAIVGARPQRLVAAALGHSPGTNGVIEAEVVRFESLEALNAAPAGSLAGKIAYVDAGQLIATNSGAGYGPLTRIRGAGPGAAADKGAVAFVMRSVGPRPNGLRTRFSMSFTRCVSTG